MVSLKLRVAIIGGEYSGAMPAVHLLRYYIPLQVFFIIGESPQARYHARIK
jgi:hypothetical protein